jgi:asparagine synthetase B (glutamine-hydrolysing)
MIAGVWSSRGPAEADHVLAQMVRAVRVVPEGVLQNGNHRLAAWLLPPVGTLDRTRNIVSLGSARRIPEAVHLQNTANIEGDYALIAQHPQGLLLSRGRHAGRCLYFARIRDGTVAACSRFEPLLACLNSLSLNVRKLGRLILAQTSADSTDTAYLEVRRVAAAEAVLFGSQGIFDVRRANVTTTVHPGTADEVAEDLRAALSRAVSRAIEGRRRVAILVSGGLDSSGVLALAVAASRGASKPELDAINLCFAGPGDDRPHMKELCKSLDIVPIRVAPSEASQNVIRALTADGAPFTSPTAGWNVALRERARERGADAILTGAGGDQVFNGDAYVLARQAWGAARCRNDLSVWRSPTLVRLARRLIAPPLVSVCPSIRRIQRQRIARARWPWAGPRLREIVRDLYVREPPSHEWMDTSGQIKLQRLLQGDFLHIAETRGQLETVTGIERLDPLMDDEVVNLVTSLPKEMLLLGGRQKGLYRYALRRVLPESLLARTDKARFEPAIAEMVRGADLCALRELASMRHLGELGLVDPARYRACFDAALSAVGTPPNWLAIWPVLAVEAFAALRVISRQEGAWAATA